tara:strand:+ start:34948 stop:35271 length:324 start_codon:yes stop_codon:yes gene_type:complete
MNASLPTPAITEPPVDVAPDRFIRQVTLTLPADVSRSGLLELLHKSGAELQISAELPWDTSYIDVIEFAHREGLLLDHNHGDVQLVRPKRRPLLQTLKQFFIQPQAF